METKQVISMPLNLTDGAINEIRHLMQAENIPAEKGLRLGVKGGGCAGFTYILEFDEKKADDNSYEIDGVKVFINRSQEMYLYGTELDFDRGLANRGFVFNNPNAQSTCGCGTSFSA